MAGGGDSLKVDVATAIAHLMLAAAAEFEKAVGRKERCLPLDQIVEKEAWGFKK